MKRSGKQSDNGRGINTEETEQEVTEDNSDEDFQPIMYRKRTKNTPYSSENKKAKLNNVVHTSSNTSATASSSSIIINLSSSAVKPSSSAVKPSSSVVESSSLVAESSSSNSNVANSSSPVSEQIKQVITIKTTIQNIWNQDHVRPLYDLVDNVNILVLHTYSFSKYIFLEELKNSIDFSLADFVTKEFFVEVFLALIIRRNVPGKVKDRTAIYRELISRHKSSYFEDAQYTPFEINKAHFGNRLRMLLNMLSKKEEKLLSLDHRMKAVNAIKEARRKEVFELLNKMKFAVSKKEIPSSDVLDEKALSSNSIYYDVKAHPEKHFNAFYKIAKLLETEAAKTFNCFPIKTSFIPSYITLDSKIVHHHILKQKTSFKAEQKFEIWSNVVNLNKKSFKPQGLNKSLRFQGTIETDGICASVLKQNITTGKKQPRMNNKKTDTIDEEYVENILPATLKENQGKYVLIDPGRRDLMFCMQESSTKEKPQILKYTKITRNKLTRHNKILSKQNTPESVKIAQLILSKTVSSSVDITKFRDYIKTRASVTHVLTRYYANETMTINESYFPGSVTEFSIRRGCLYYGDLFVINFRGYYPQPKDTTSTTADLNLYATYLEIMLKQKHIAQRLTATTKNSLNALISNMSLSNEDNGLKHKASTQLEKLRLLPFRKIKFNSKLYYDQNDANLVQRLKLKFGKNSILVIGNWSAPNTKFQEPTRSKGLIKMLKKAGFTVLLIDEFKTSSYCPTCESELETFKTVVNPRPYKRADAPTVECHGLLR
ncbi:uncharacterized protein B0P05DRAFT_610463 [Gilbertella persicaria]|uniref:uncharacterized protein n=1 Tax=Gilbertella persicaria TaxID=101096 RepID=UPI00221E796E|nr:uncharacterized protein B0P05DRAFT_610463 [Gilbertella persicaria]KAI8083294.1 hypothetical protein B0P05DRAFT_610463 [Gilbertella persicaria]